jgi:hypothetical protein
LPLRDDRLRLSRALFSQRAGAQRGGGAAPGRATTSEKKVNKCNKIITKLKP